MTNDTPWRPPADTGGDASAPAPFSSPVPPPSAPLPPTYGPPQVAAPQPPSPQYGPPPPQYGQYAPPQVAQPQYAPPQYLQNGAPFAPPPGYAPAGWAPPPKPGLIPLRPLTLGMTLSASFQVLRRNPRPTFGLSLLVNGGIMLLGIGAVGLVTVIAASRAFSAVGADSETVQAGAFAMTLLAALVPLVLSVVGMAVLQGIIALEVARGTVGEKLKLRGLWRAARGRIGALIGWSLLVVAAVSVAITVVVLLIVLVATVGGAAGVGVGVIIGILAFGGALVLTAWLATRLAFVPSVLMLERLSIRAAVKRSWSLSVGYFWRTFGILLLVGFILYMVSSIISTPLSLLSGFGATLINPNGSMEESIGLMIAIVILSFVISVVFSAMSAVIQTATAALLYLDLRMRKEGLDLELTRFVEARQAGDTSVENPYLVRHPYDLPTTARVL